MQTALVAFDNYTQVTDTLTHVDRALSGRLNAFEIIWQAFYRLNTIDAKNSETNGATGNQTGGHSGSSKETAREGDVASARSGAVAAPLARDYPVYAIIEARGNETDADATAFDAVMESALERELFTDAVIAKSEQERLSIWSIRENVERAGRPGDVFVYDISLPIGHADDYLTNVEQMLQSDWPGTTLYAYGHLADGNIHLQVALPDGMVDDSSRAELHHACNNLVYLPLQSLNGSISAEHGIGLAKKSYLERSRNAAELALMQTLKGRTRPEPHSQSRQDSLVRHQQPDR